MSSFVNISASQMPDISATVDSAEAKLMSLRIRITDQCDMKCRHCMRPAPRRGSLFDFNRFGPQLIEDLNYLGTNEVVITGGEPTVEMDLTCEIGSRLIDAGIVSILFTNAYDVSRDDFQRLFDAGIFTMHVSLDGMEITHDWIRRTPGAFKQTLANINLASRMGFQVVARMTLTRHNIAEVEQVAAAVDDAGATIFKIRPVVPAGRASRDLCPSSEQLAAAVKQVTALSQRQQVTFGSSCFQYLQGVGMPMGGCFTRHLHVDPRGNIIPCGYVKLPLGNLERNRLPEVFYGPRLNALRRQALPSFCLSCEHANTCRGGCRACAIGSGLRSDEPDTYCPRSRRDEAQTYVSGATGAHRITYSRSGVLELMPNVSKSQSVSNLARDRSGKLYDPNSNVVVFDENGVCISKPNPANSPSPIQVIWRSELPLWAENEPGFVVVEFDGFRFCHFGRLKFGLTDDNVAALAPIDAVLGIAGEVPDEATLAQTAQKLGTKIFIPLFPQCDDLKTWRAALRLRRGVRFFPDDYAFVDLNTLPRELEIWLFGGEQHSADRSMAIDETALMNDAFAQTIPNSLTTFRGN